MSATGFDLDLRSILLRLRIYDLSLTRNSDRADDPVQQTALKALAGRDSFRAGTNFAGWIFRRQRNDLVSEIRRTRADLRLRRHGAQPAFRAAPKRPAPARAYRRLAPGFALRCSYATSRGTPISRSRTTLAFRLAPHLARPGHARAPAEPPANLVPALAHSHHD
jgi:hypothetical protein